MGDMSNIYPSTNTDVNAVSNNWLDSLQKACHTSDTKTFCDLFIESGWLRDLLCFSWDFRTLSGREKISAYLDDAAFGSTGGLNPSRLANSAIHDITLDCKSTLGGPSQFPIPGASNPDANGVLAFFRFSMNKPARSGRGAVRLLPAEIGSEVQWKALTLLMSVHELQGYEEPAGRPLGVWNAHTLTWGEVKYRMIKDVEDDPTVLIIGGGQSGVMCAARLGRMGIRALVIEKTKRFGDVWRHRYPNLTLHTPAHHSSLLYHSYPKTYPYYLPKDIVADFLESYVLGQNIVGWLSTTFLSDPAPSYDNDARRWTIHVERVHYLQSGEEDKRELIVLRPRHIIYAAGNGRPKVPSCPGMDIFKGDVYHSDQHSNTSKYRGKKAVVVGACNAAADAAKSFLSESHPANSVTMIQRSPTCVLSQETAEKTIFATASIEDRDPEDDDFSTNSMPLRLLLDIQAKYGGTAKLKEMDNELHRGLQEKGFRLTWEAEPNGGEVGLLGFFYDRVASGSMLDFGCGQSIIDGKINVHSGAGVDHFLERGIVLTDGTYLDADVVVFATGYYPIIDNAIQVFGKDIMQNVGDKIWGLDTEGELRKCYRPTGVRCLWFAPGAFQHARFFSRHLAIQILAEEKGLKR